MADLATAPAVGDGTSQGTAVATATTPTAPATGTEGRASVTESATTPAPAPSGTSQDVEFTDGVNPETLPPEIRPLWESTHKQMKAALTRKFQEFGADRDLLTQAKQFMRDPITGMQQMAAQHGYTLTRKEAAAAVAQGQGQPSGPWQPETYEEIVERAVGEAMKKVQEQFAPVVQNVQQMQAKNIEAQLDGIDKDWRKYEPELREILDKHPSLIADLPRLYRNAVPPEVFESRAVQHALSRMKETASTAAVGGKTTVSQSTPAPRKATNFNEAVAIAKEKLGLK